MIDIGLRDWLLILGPIFIAGVLIHGYWRMKRSPGKLKMSLDKSFLSAIEKSEEENFSHSAELPNGGARIVSRLTGGSDSAEKSDLNFEDDVPVLMESVKVDDQESESSQYEFESLKTDEPLGLSPTRESKTSKVRHKEVKLKRPDKFVIMNLFSKNEKFSGQQLLEALVTCGMKFGDMNIFHYPDENDATVFSLANAVEPGTFDLKAMEQLLTPGVTCFLKLHEVDNPMDSFEQMIAVMHKLALELNGVLKDDSHSTLTQQTIEHERQIVREYSARYA